MSAAAFILTERKIFMDKELALIVEDNALLSNLFSRALRDVDYNTLVMRDGRMAQDWLLACQPDVLFLDLHLPKVSGQEILEAIWDQPRFAQTHIVLVTADARLGEMLADKAAFLLNKPVDIRQLQQLAKRLKQDRVRI